MSDASPLEIRPAAPADARFFWEVNNHPSVRAQSVNQEEILWEDHLRWFTARLDRDGAHTLVVDRIGSGGATPIGVLRFDPSVGSAGAVISVALCPEARGQGLGRRAISEGTSWVLSRGVHTVIAFIRPENLGSMRAFEAAGYQSVETIQQQGVTLARLVCRAAAAEVIEVAE